jgi:putative peptidoglycan lipid II flippase
MWAIGLWLSRNVFPSLGWLQLGALALGYSISTFLELGLLLWLLSRKMGGIDGKRLFSGLWRMLLATLVMIGITWIVMAQIVDLGLFWQLLIGGMVGATSYIVASLLFGVKELRQLTTYGQVWYRNRKGRG